ncbi:MAG TPA: caspase family protein, partial [Candidatus Methanoperedens sp.]
MNNQNRHALLIGINSYPNLPPQYKLDGCINDIELMAGILKNNFGFPESNITVLRDEEATRVGILGAFNALSGSIGENDIAVIYYSGHGSQMRDREGDEPDGWDETIVPYDSGRGSYPNRDISDDEIYLWLLQLTERTPYVTLIFDCCNSGTIARDVFSNKSRWVEPDLRPVEELPPSPVMTGMMKVKSRDIGPSGWLPLGERYVLIAGCKDNESSYEHNIVQDRRIVHHGALTYFLAQELAKAGPGATYRDIFECASVNVTVHHPHQHPQMEGRGDRELFGIRDIRTTRFVYVRQRTGDKIILGAGAAHGMTVHSKWAIYPQGIKQFDSQRIGLVEITGVGAVTSEARIAEETKNGIIAVNSRAVEEEHFYGEMRLEVEIQVPGIYQEHSDRLAERIRRSLLLSLVESGEMAEIRVYLLAKRTDARTGDPVPQLGNVDKPVWAAVGQDGKLIMPIHDINESGVVSILCDNLEKIARYRQAIVLKNPNEESLLNGKIDFSLRRQKAGGTWEAAEPDNDSGYVIFEEGERISCEIINNHDQAVY